MLNKAMNTMEQLRKAEELRISLINEAREALVILGAETQAENIQPITINKGKIVEVKTTEVKEVVIDNTDTTTIEMLRETIRNNNEALNDAYAEIEQLKAEIAELKATKEEVIETIQAVEPVVSETIFKVKEEPKEEESLRNKVIVTNKEYRDEDNKKLCRVEGEMYDYDETKYEFSWTFGYATPMIYGFFDEDRFYNVTRKIMNETGMETETNSPLFIHNESTLCIYEDDKIAIYRDGHTFIGYTENVCFKWDTDKYDVPKRKLIENALSDNPNHWNKMNNTKDRKLTKEGEFIVDFIIKQYPLRDFGEIAINAHEDKFRKHNPFADRFKKETEDENKEVTEDELEDFVWPEDM